MAKYRKKPIVVEAYQITEELIKSILLDGTPYPVGLFFGRASYNSKDRTIDYWSGHVKTIHLQVTNVGIGDWIIAESDGRHFYPCKPDIFEATYDLVSVCPDPMPDEEIIEIDKEGNVSKVP